MKWTVRSNFSFYDPELIATRPYVYAVVKVTQKQAIGDGWGIMGNDPATGLPLEWPDYLTNPTWDVYCA